ncbi:MAG: hypothetical protein K5908_03510 [Erysipelotrichaceae bacterium]|nr:hypothetical protein [Erysipelotrichaceae bacterium]
MTDKRNQEMVLFMLSFVLVRNVLEYLFCLFSKVPFHFDPMADLIIPMMIAGVLAYLLFVYRKK